MTEKNTSLNSTGFETLARGLNGEKAVVTDFAVAFQKNGRAVSTIIKDDYVNYLNGSKSDHIMSKVKEPMLKELCENILPVGAVQVNATLRKRIERREYDSILDDLYMYAEENQRDNCDKLVDYLQIKFGKDNTQSLEDALNTVKNENIKEGNSRQPKESETIMVMTKRKY